MLMRLWAAITGQRAVYLRDSDGETTLTVASIRSDWPWSNNKTWTAKRHWPFDIRIVRLGPDGEVINGSYVKQWKWADTLTTELDDKG